MATRRLSPTEAFLHALQKHPHEAPSDKKLSEVEKSERSEERGLRVLGEMIKQRRGLPAGDGPAQGSKAATQRSPEEQEIIDLVARRNGRDWAERHANLILEQARSVGDL